MEVQLEQLALFESDEMLFSSVKSVGRICISKVWRVTYQECEVWFTVVSIQSRFGTSPFDTNRSKFVTNVKSIRYKLTSLQIVSIQNTIRERTQTSVVNETNPYLREPPHVPKRPTQWEHVNETKFWFGLFIENRDLYKWFWDFFYNSSAYYA